MIASDTDYVILRLPDVIGPRDTTYKWWIYQLWMQLSPVMIDHPIHIPGFLETLDLSLVFSEDVARAVTQVLLDEQVRNKVQRQAFNLAFEEPVTMLQVFDEMKRFLRRDDVSINIINEESHLNHFYAYPSTRSGPVNVSKAMEVLSWKPTDFSSAIRQTVEFFEQAMTSSEFAGQRDEIVQVVGETLFRNNLMKFYENLEKVYSIDLKHFKYPKDEL